MVDALHEIISILFGFFQWWVPWAVLSFFLLYQNRVMIKYLKKANRVIKHDEKEAALYGIDVEIATDI